jgi:hypothetical protein
MIGIDAPRPGSLHVTSQDLTVARIVCARQGYEIVDFQDQRIGWEETLTGAHLHIAAELLEREPQWEELANGTHRLITPSHLCIIRESKAGWSSTITHHGKYLKTLEANPNLAAAQTLTEHLVNLDHGHRVSSSPLLDIADVVKAGFKAIEFAIAPSLLGLDRPEFTLWGNIEKVAKIIFKHENETGHNLYPVLHSNVAALVKRNVLAIFNGDRSTSHYANDMLEGSEDLEPFRRQFASAPWSDADYSDFVENKLIKLTEEREAMLYGG